MNIPSCSSTETPRVSRSKHSLLRKLEVALNISGSILTSALHQLGCPSRISLTFSAQGREDVCTDIFSSGRYGIMAERITKNNSPSSSSSSNRNCLTCSSQDAIIYCMCM
ncbi:hypothetical protein HU200_046656 [Digitaria exilis]|uniref:Uncharacterized protein n=1 Tax=Digitaria exilis TaxID=1010633 RepID=A0A835EDL5_9POAL|nr:hypothetical protein HU200_046656 [Digitaria exilis]